MSAEDEGDGFQFGMGFAGVACPGCGTVAEPGPCESCGVDVPAPDGPDEATLVRREVLLEIRTPAEAALDAFDDLPEPRIPITPTVLLSGLVEADLFQRMIDVNGLGHALGRLDLDDPDVVRGPVREAVLKRLEDVHAMVAASQDLSVFRSAPPGDKLRDVAIRLGQRGGRLLVAFLAALTAVDLAAARDAEAGIQAELDDFADGDVLSAVLDELSAAPSGTNERIGTALARNGTFTDAFGAVDLARVFWAFRGSADPRLDHMDGRSDRPVGL